MHSKSKHFNEPSCTNYKLTTDVETAHFTPYRLRIFLNNLKRFGIPDTKLEDQYQNHQNSVSQYVS